MIKEYCRLIKTNALKQETKLFIIIISVCLSMAHGYWVLLSPGIAATNEIIKYIIFNIAINAIGIYIAFRINQKGDDDNFFERYLFVVSTVSILTIIIDVLFNITISVSSNNGLLYAIDQFWSFLSTPLFYLVVCILFSIISQREESS